MYLKALVTITFAVLFSGTVIADDHKTSRYPRGKIKQSVDRASSGR